MFTVNSYLKIKSNQVVRAILKMLFYSALVPILLCIIMQESHGQTMEAPGIEWMKTDYYHFNPPNSTTPQTKDDSGEDWWYAHENVIIGGGQTGYICAGYSTFVNWFHNETSCGSCFNSNLNGNLNTSCLREYDMGTYTWNNNDFDGTSVIQGLCMKDLRGNTIWHKLYNQGFFYNVHPTTDGGFIAIGLSYSTRDPLSANCENLQYQDWNGGLAGPTTFSCTGAWTNARKRICVVKTDSDGNVQWEYLYGAVESSDNNFLDFSGEGFDIAEYDNNGTPAYVLVGWSNDQTLGLQNDAIIINIDNNGKMLEDRKILPPTQFGGYRVLAGIAASEISGKMVVAATGRNDISATEANVNLVINNDFLNTGVQGFNEYNLPNINPGLGTEAASYDIIFRPSNNNILIGAIQSCDGCKFSDYNNKGLGVVIETDLIGVVLGTYNLGLNNNNIVNAYDLKVGVCNTNDNGFAAVSSKIDILWKDEYNFGNNITWNCTSSIGPINGSTRDWWNSDAYVAKFDPNGTLEWEKQWDEDADPPEPFPGDHKKQECMYTITQADDGGLVVAGNYSSNFDDTYLVKLFSDCSQRVMYDIDPTPQTSTTINVNTVWSTDMKIKGSIIIPNGVVLNINSGAKIEFADSRAIDADNTGLITNIVVQPGGKLVVTEGAVLTSLNCSGNMWDGVQVLGDPNVNQNYQSQGAVEITSGGTIENAIIGIMACQAEYDDVEGIPYLVINPSWTAGGGIVRTFPTALLQQNRHGIHFGPYTLTNNLSFINGTQFTCYGSLPGSYYNGDGTTQFVSMWDVRDIDIINNTFDGYSGFNYENRGVAITAYDANIRAYAIGGTGNTFNNLYHGIDGWYTGVDLNAHTIANNTFTNCWGGVYLNNTKVIYVQGNRMLGIPNSDTDPGFGVWMDHCQLFDINNNNYFEGQGLLHQGASYGVVVTNSSTGGRTIDHNQFAKTLIGTQAEGDNPQLDIRCNTYTAHDAHAWAVLKDINGAGVLKDQGTGTQLPDERPQNTFDEWVACPNGEDHIYSDFLFDYFVFNNTSMSATYPQCSSPILLAGGGTGIQTANLQGSEEQCTIDDPCPTLPCEQMRAAFNSETDSVKKLTLLNEIVMQYAAKDTLGNDALLTDFLENVGHPVADKILIPLYLKHKQITEASNLLTIMPQSTDEDKSFVAYYNLIANIMDSATGLISLDALSLTTLQQMASSKTPTAIFAENVLIKNDIAQYKHHIIPIQNKIIRQAKPFNSDLATSELKLIPNPSSGEFQLIIPSFDSNMHYTVSITNALGKIERIVNQNSMQQSYDCYSLPNGVYQVSILLDGIAWSNAKLVLVK